jgi:hypothetical protein
MANAKTETRPQLVRITSTCFIDERLRQPGEVVETCVPITPDGPFVDANEEIAPPRAKRTLKSTKSASGGSGVPAPEWTTEGHREKHNLTGPIGMQPGRSQPSIEVTPP